MSDQRSDAGAQTQANFHYQHCSTARWCVLLLRGTDGITCIRCETHDDFTIEYQNRQDEVVSVKYRDGSRGPWTLARLTAEGVLRGLFDRWVKLGEGVSCRLLTNAAFDTEVKSLRDACPQGDDATRAAFAQRLADALSTDAETAARFLGVLSLESHLVSRENVERIEAFSLRGPMKAFNVADPGDPRYFTSLVELVAAANRAVDPVDVDAIDVSFAARMRRQADARRLDRPRIIGALLEVVTASEPVLTPGEAIGDESTKLVRKLVAGGMPPTTIRSAQILRAAWSDHEARWRAEVPGGDAEWDDLRIRVAHIAGQSERAIDRSDQYGPAMLADLESRLTENALGRSPAIPISDLLLLGLAYQLTDECEIYWSPEELVT